ncbi:MAG: Atxe2 family lasso peptide isopeptidase [Emcibacter sp.]|nr:Atxe2 family lasso peptide isopeptidase [Emcibacter sp.]
MRIKSITRPRNNLWLFFPLLIACCFIIEPAAAKLDSNPAPKRGITIDDLSAIKDITIMTVSSDGKYIAFQTKQGNKDTNSYILEWYVSETRPDAKLTLVADSKEAAFTTQSNGFQVGNIAKSEIIWSRDSQWIYFTKPQGDRGTQLWRSHRSRYGQVQMTHNAGNLQGLQKMTANGSKIFYTIGRTRAETAALIKKENRKGYLMQVPLTYYLMYGAILPPCTDGKIRVTSQVKKGSGRNCRLTVWIFDMDTGQERKATVAEIKEFNDGPDSEQVRISQGVRMDEYIRMQRPSPDGKDMAWIENLDPEIYKGPQPPMVVAASYKGKKIRCPARQCTGEVIKDLWWYPNGTNKNKEIIFQVRDGRRHSLMSFYGWTPGDSQVRTIISNDDLSTDCELNIRRLICGHETWTSPKKISSINLDNGKVSTIIDVNPDFRNFNLTKIEKIFMKDAYGYDAHAHLVYPKDYKKGQTYPLVIVQYGFRGFLRGAVGDEQPIHVYAENGIMVLCVSKSNTSGSAKEANLKKNQFKSSYHTLIQQGPATAIENMVDDLVQRGMVDPKRVGISGLSTGASITDTALLRRNYAAASAAYSVTLSTKFLFSASSSSGTLGRKLFGTTSNLKMGHKYSIDINAHKVETPLLLQVADKEAFVSSFNYNALLDAGKPVEMYIYPDEFHVKWLPAHRYQVYSRNLDWFNFWLRDVEDPDPGKAEQYKRWRALRDKHLSNLKAIKGRQV